MWWAAIGAAGGTRRADGMANHPAVRTSRALGEINARELEQLGLPVERADTAGQCGIGDRVGLQQITGAFELGGGIARGEEAVVPDLHKTRWQHVEQEAPNERVRWQGDAAPALGGKANPGGVDALQALIGETDAMGVAAEVAKDMLRAAEGALGVDDPLDAVELVDESLERDRVTELLGPTPEVQFVVAMRFGECRQKPSAKEPREHRYREEVAATRRLPMRAVEGESPAGDDTVHVGVKLQLPRPGVQNGSDAEVRSQPRRVVTERQ